VLGLTSDTLPLTTVDAYAENISGYKDFADIRRWPRGYRRSAEARVRVQLDPQALAARGINLEDVRTALGQANVDLRKARSTARVRPIRSTQRSTAEGRRLRPIW